MDTVTTTDAATQDEALVDPTVEAQPPEAEQPAEAVTTDSEPISTETTDEPASTDTSEDDDQLTPEQLQEWAGKKGIDLSTPEGQAKALKSLRSAEKKMHQATSQASELATKVSASPVDPDASEAQKALHIATQLQNAQVINTWKASNNISQAEDAAMGKYATENPQTAQLLTQGLITLDEFRAIAGSTQQVDTAAIKESGKKEALESLANKQRATAVAGNASRAASPAKTDAVADVWSNDND